MAFAHEEVAKTKLAIDAGIHRLRPGLIDRTGDRPATRLASAAAGRFHDARATACHDGEARPGQGAADRARELVVRIVLPRPGRAEHGHARADEVEHPKAADELVKDPRRMAQLRESTIRAGQERTTRAAPGCAASSHPSEAVVHTPSLSNASARCDRPACEDAPPSATHDLRYGRERCSACTGSMPTSRRSDGGGRPRRWHPRHDRKP
jgi:hypothetical protein